MTYIHQKIYQESMKAIADLYGEGVEANNVLITRYGQYSDDENELLIEGHVFGDPKQLFQIIYTVDDDTARVFMFEVTRSAQKTFLKEDAE